MPNTIAQNLIRLANAKEAIAGAIEAKGGVLEEGDGFEDFADAISSITTESNLTTKTIIQNGTYTASTDNVDGYSAVTVAVPLDNVYFGTPIAKTSADTVHIRFKEFPSGTYGKFKAGPVMCSEFNDIFPFTSFSIASNQESAQMTYSNTTAQLFIYNATYPRIIVPNVDYYTLSMSSFTDDYAISSKAGILSFQYEAANPYVVLAFGKTTNSGECMVFAANYNDASRYLIKNSFGTVMSGDSLEHWVSSYVSGGVALVPIQSDDGTKIMDGLYRVIYGENLHGFYEICGQLFFVSAGIAIKDE